MFVRYSIGPMAKPHTEREGVCSFPVVVYDRMLHNMNKPIKNTIKAQVNICQVKFNIFYVNAHPSNQILV